MNSHLFEIQSPIVNRCRERSIFDCFENHGQEACQDCEKSCDENEKADLGSCRGCGRSCCDVWFESSEHAREARSALER